MPSTVDLATSLQAMPDDTLDHMVRSRGVPQHIGTYFDLADHLLSSASIARALETASAAELQAVAGGSTPPRLDALGLGVDGTPFLEVRRQAEAAPAAPSPDPVAEPDDAAAAERALHAVTTADELLDALVRRPAQLRTRGTLSLVDARRLAEAIDVEPEDVLELAEVLEAAGLAARHEALLRATTEIDAWLERPTAERWAAIVQGWLASLAEPERRAAVEVPEAWPVTAIAPLAAGDAAARLEHVRAIAHRLGLQAGGPTGLATARAEALERLVPAPVEHAYVQPDLTIVVPGPLASAAERRLRRIADVEQRGLASTYRLSHASLSRAFASGEAEQSVLEFLATLSLTGVPQPVEYLVHDAASRFGALRVQALDPSAQHEHGARTAVRSDDAALLSQLEVDRSIAAFGLQRSGEHRLVTRIAADLLLDALTAQRYPAVLEDAAGTIAEPRRHLAAPAPSRPSPLVQRLRGTGFDVGEGEQAWLERRLSLAARDRVTVQVRVAVGADVRDLALLPLGVANGRLRARDTASDVERTLPISAITHVTGAP